VLIGSVSAVQERSPEMFFSNSLSLFVEDVLGLTRLYLRKIPDGTVIWTSPSRSTYVTKPGSALWFPSLRSRPVSWIRRHEPALDHGQRDRLAGVLGAREHVERDELGAV
jgi:hypothetical protein